MSRAKPPAKNAAKTVLIPLAKELNIDVDLRRLVDAYGDTVPEMTLFLRRARLIIHRIKEGEETGIPSTPLFIYGPLSYESIQKVIGSGLLCYPLLRVVQLHHCELGDDSISKLVDFILEYKPDQKKNPFGIESLEIPGCAVGPRGMKYLSRLVTENTTITRLVLDFNEFGDEGVITLCDGMRWNASLSHLSLQYCGITSEGAAKIASHIVKGSNTRSLSLRGNPLGAEGVGHIGKAITLSTTIQRLDIADTQFGQSLEAVQSLCWGLEANYSLLQLDLDFNLLLPAGAEALLLALKRNTSVGEIRISDRIAPDVYKEILETVGKRAPKKKKAPKPAPKK